MKIKSRDLPFVWIGTLLFVVILLVALFGIPALMDSFKTEKPFSYDLSARDKVYVDIIEMSPQYYSSHTSGALVDDVICQCKTTAGATVWVSVDAFEYDGFLEKGTRVSSGFRTERGYEADYPALSFSKPLRIHGFIIHKKSTIVKEVKNQIGTDVIVSFENF